MIVKTGMAKNSIKYELLSNSGVSGVDKQLIINYVKKLPPYSEIASNINSERFLSIYMATKYALLYSNGIKYMFSYCIYIESKVTELVFFLIHDLDRLKPTLRSKLKKIKLISNDDRRFVYSCWFDRDKLLKLSIYFDNYVLFVKCIAFNMDPQILLLTIDCRRDDMFNYLLTMYIGQRSLKEVLLNLVALKENNHKVVLLPTFKRLGYFEYKLFLYILFENEFFKQIVSLDIYETIVDLYYDKDAGPGYKKWEKEMNEQYKQIEKAISEPIIC